MTQALQPLVRELVEDMRERLDDDAERTAGWRATHTGLIEAQRTGATWTDWAAEQLTQAAVGWVLTSVFVRFCEDNDLLGLNKRWISGADADGRSRAVDEQERFFAVNLNQGFRGYLRYAFSQVERSAAAAALVGEHAAIHIAEPSDQAAQRLVEFWRQADAENATVWALADPDLDTRFLGDLYEHLSEFAQKKYALRQTPEFIEEFILDRTLTPALAERRPRRPAADGEGRSAPVGFKIIDPTCGSGHFLLGAFSRLLDYWRQAEPGLDAAEHARLTLESIHGVDINPFAVAIAQFRLVVAALQAMGMMSLLDPPQLPLKVYAGDSLLWSEDSAGQSGLEYGMAFDPDAVASGVQLATEDVAALRRVLARDQYDVVVGNPPYITVKDKALNQRYRELYNFCKRKYALTAPFMEQFHALAKSGTMEPNRAGWIGQITSNSFMAREFGVPLIEEFLPSKDLFEVVDTSGVPIPGHGTPTVILVSRNRAPQTNNIRAVLGIQGEPATTTGAANGQLWQSIVENVDKHQHEDQWITVAELPREIFKEHPWSLQGGAAQQTADVIDKASVGALGDLVRRIGFFAVVGADDAFQRVGPVARREDVRDFYKPLVEGELTRDYNSAQETEVWYPYDSARALRITDGAVPLNHLWPYRTVLFARATFSGGTYWSDGRPWFEWHQLPADKDASPMSLAFAFVATHNHFVVDRGGKVFNRSAPVIKLPAGASEDEHLDLLGVLNSSTACFWLKQNSYPKSAEHQPWANRFEFTGTTLKDFPLPRGSSRERSRRIDSLAQELAATEPAALLEKGAPSAELFARGEAEWERIRSLMIAEQEELDWQVYHLYGFTEADESLSVGATPGIALGERAFEIALARKVEAREAETAWFERHRSTPVTQIPGHLPEEYRRVVQRRLDLIAADRSLDLLERPEYKRRWTSTPWRDRVRSALASWILDRLENVELWKAANGYPQPQSVRQLAAKVETDPSLDGVAEALELWSAKRQAGVLANLLELLKDEAVPHLAAMRLKDSGLRKFAAWQTTWEAQRAEDRGEISTAQVPVPPRYTSADFRKDSYWQARGKLDVPKERFIAYPGASGPDDPTPMLGWAGWDHAEQGIALLSLHDDRKDDTPGEQLTPLVAGLAELMPWIRQWHSGMDAESGLDWADYLGGQLTALADDAGIVVTDLADWRPAPATRGRARGATAAPTTDTEN